MGYDEVVEVVVAVAVPADEVVEVDEVDEVGIEDPWMKNWADSAIWLLPRRIGWLVS
jgi:hypothetical protein